MINFNKIAYFQILNIRVCKKLRFNWCYRCYGSYWYNVTFLAALHYFVLYLDV